MSAVSARCAPGLAILLVAAGALGACAPRSANVMDVDGRAIGTTWSLRVVDEEGDADPDRLRDLVERSLERVDAAASTWREDSEVSAAAALEPGDTLPITDDLVAILDAALEAYTVSGGAFDPTVGPLVAAHGFGAGAAEVEATPEALAAAAARLGFEAFQWSDGHLTRARSDVSLDLSGVAKGYAVDVAAEALLAAGEDRFLLEIGGELRVAGLRASGTPWVVGIYEPLEGRSIHGTVEVSDVAVATSGDYRAFRDLEDGTRVSHTIDPRSGRAARSGVASVTITAPDCARADALATAVMVLGADEGLALVESLPGVEAYLLLHVRDGFEVRSSSGFPSVAIRSR